MNARIPGFRPMTLIAGQLAREQSFPARRTSMTGDEPSSGISPRRFGPSRVPSIVHRESRITERLFISVDCRTKTRALSGLSERIDSLIARTRSARMNLIRNAGARVFVSDRHRTLLGREDGFSARIAIYSEASIGKPRMHARTLGNSSSRMNYRSSTKRATNASR